MDEDKEIQNLLSEYFSQKDEIDTVILFGSFAKGTYSPHSDIDLAVHSARQMDFPSLAGIQTDLALLCHREVDLTDLSNAEGVFLYQIMTTGVRIKFSPDVYVKHLVKALCFKEDFLPTIEFSRRVKIRRFIDG